MEEHDGQQYRIYTDTGGTFTDCVIVTRKGKVIIGKSPTTPADLKECFFKSIEATLEVEDVEASEEFFVNTRVVGYGTTQGTNLVITGTGAPNLGFITTKGHEDRTLIGRYRAAGLPPEDAMHLIVADKPEPLVPRNRIKGVAERVDSFGEILVSLQEDEIRNVVKNLVEKDGVEGISVGFLWSFINPKNELRVREIIHELYPDLPVALSHEVNPIIREEPRFRTTHIDLYIGKALRVLLADIEQNLHNRGYQYPLLVLQAAGGVSRAEIVKPANTLHSGPVGGLMGVDFLKGLYDIDNAIGSDVGGTSFDITLLSEKGLEYLREPIVGRFQISNPMLEIKTIGAGGGTIAWVDSVTNKLRLGPRSASSNPGPVCYGKGGTEPTVTDADLVLNRLDPDYFLGGRIKLDRDKAVQAIEEKIAKPLNMDVYDAAEAIVSIADATMGIALRGMLAEKGCIPDRFTLFAFGGAGPAHCAGYSENIEFKEVIVPQLASVFSAFGASTAAVRHRHEQSPFVIIPELPFDQVSLEFDKEQLTLDMFPEWARSRLNDSAVALEKAAMEDMYAEGFKDGEFSLRYEIAARYGRQLWEVRVETPGVRLETKEDCCAMLQAFEKEYSRTYGQAAMVPAGGIEIIMIVVEAIANQEDIQLLSYEFEGTSPEKAKKGSRNVRWKEGFLDSAVYDWDLVGNGNEIYGPAIVESTTTTFVIPPGRKVTVDQYHNMRMNG